MILLVCGGRDYDDRDYVWAYLDMRLATCPVGETLTIVEGGASGADSLARSWARDKIRKRRNVRLITVSADWQKHGRAAGPIRNQQMLTEHKPDLVAAFPGGKGTNHMVTIAKEQGFNVDIL